MSAAYSPAPIVPADISLKANGTPVSTAFDDVYFSVDDGFAESRYVFLAHNQLWQRWLAYEEPYFVIAETGFGTGLNFLLTCLLFQQFKIEHPNVSFQLHYISFEKHPIPTNALRQIHQHFVEQEPALAAFTTLLQANYPSFIPGCHRLTLNDIQLDLHFGDIIDCIEVIPLTPQGLVDAWYLDGFAPSKNTAMWSDRVLLKMGEMAKVGGTFSTFTAAGFVKRALQAAEFEVTKVKGFGRKREMLTGRWIGAVPPLKRAYYQRLPSNAFQKDLTIIGGGLASASLLYELAKYPESIGKITLICEDDALAQAASGNQQGGFYPLLHADFDPLTEFYSLAFDYAHREYRRLQNQQPFDGDFCGVLALAHNDDFANRYQKVRESKRWPNSFASWLDANEASAAANVELPYPGFNFAQGGWISPPSLTKALIEVAKSTLTIDIQFKTTVTQIKPVDDQWQLTCSPKHSQSTSSSYVTLANQLVLCAGSSTSLIMNEQSEVNSQLPPTFPMMAVRGQVSYPKVTEATESLARVLCFSGYMTPAYNGAHCIGSTFKKHSVDCEVKLEEHVEIQQLFQKEFAQQSWVYTLQSDAELRGNAAIRATLPDHLPLVGGVPSVSAYASTYSFLWKRFPHCEILPPDYANLYVLSGLGARGLCAAPLSAAILVSQLLNKPYPVSERVLAALSPNRFLIRKLRKPPSQLDT